MTEFSDLVRTKRKERGLTVRDLERLLSKRRGGPTISRTLISYLETGERVPTYYVAYAIAEALELAPIEVIEAAFISRIRHGHEREARYLEDFRDQMGLEWALDDVIQQAYRRLKK